MSKNINRRSRNISRRCRNSSRRVRNSSRRCRNISRGSWNISIEVIGTTVEAGVKSAAHHFLVAGLNLSILARSLFSPIPPTTYTDPLNKVKMINKVF